MKLSQGDAQEHQGKLRQESRVDQSQEDPPYGFLGLLSSLSSYLSHIWHRVHPQLQEHIIMGHQSL